MAKPTQKETRAQVRKSLSILRKAGLYNPKSPRAAPTRYAKSLVTRYADVVSRKAFVVSVPKAAQKQISEQYRVHRGKAIVSKDTFTDRARFDKKTGGVVKYKTLKGGGYFKFQSANVKTLEELPKLKKGQTYAVPFRQGRNIEFQTRADLDELIKLINSYETRKTREGKAAKGYEDIIRYIQIGTRVEPRRQTDDDEEDDG